MQNSDIARALRSIGHNYSDNDPYRKVAHFKAADAIESLSNQVVTALKVNPDFLLSIPGIGQSINSKVLDIIANPPVFEEEKATDEPARIPREKVEGLVEKLLAILGPICNRVEVAGSWRRGLPDVKDIDIVAESTNPGLVTHTFKSIPGVVKVLWTGDVKTSCVYKHDDVEIQVDIRLCHRKSFGACMMYFTGDRNFNPMLRGFAKQKGMRLNEYGLWNVVGKDELEFISGYSEEAIFEDLGVKYIEPEDRNASVKLEIVNGS